jgi:hypothetical protein
MSTPVERGIIDHSKVYGPVYGGEINYSTIEGSVSGGQVNHYHRENVVRKEGMGLRLIVVAMRNKSYI